MATKNIANGCILLARVITDSDLWRESPDMLKLFLYLLLKARHHIKPQQFDGFKVERGELVTSLAELAEANSRNKGRWLRKWSREKVRRMLSEMVDKNMIVILRDTYGTHIRICNYETYQNLESYRRDSSETAARLNNNGNNDTDGTFTFVLKGGDSWYLPQAKLEKYKDTYPNLDIGQQLRKAAQWTEDNPNKRKTAGGMYRFINNWLSKADTQAKPKREPKPGDYDWYPTEEQAERALQAGGKR